ncbi:MAG TPA: AbrB/MazE/SpoVT family DNA-binding domain-containing protein [Thermoanaerobaculales bacterium]|nr:AbrB/MazE/SpoVT family DNA-binding domain-containing protein [Thermoanaerobaculales bacterium]HPA82794.1 AbrB/MazE/SpoVT family DNA-binding domain-containing protein [Thermoanaerobaculales bacterium]HQL28862.1 AbrB/MazE/SpoVT family DNA-binding domain-containing protein [Thermoanaerobaculales bacterium]
MGGIDATSLLRYLHCRYIGGDVKARVQRWGNSLAVRIPKAFADDLGLADGAAVELTLDEGSLVLRPQLQPTYRLEELLDRVTRENRHGEEDLGPPAGGEVW